MPDSSTNPIASNRLPHCSHRTQQGKRCRLPAIDANRALCFRHAGLRAQEVDSGDLSADLLGDLTDFQSAVQINAFLGKLLVLLAKDRVATKRAAVLTYICAQLLRTMPEIDRELNPTVAENRQIIIDLPRPIRDS